ncbi:uncharacterized protein cd5 isoform 2-T2 [Synchiropus picturatus]
MEPSTLVLLAALLLLTIGSAQTNMNHSSPPPGDAHLRATTGPGLSACPGAAQPAFFMLHWTGLCAAEVREQSVNSSTLACLANLTKVKRLLSDVCKNKKGCSGDPDFTEQQGEPDTSGVICVWLTVACNVEAVADEGQQQAYKVATALLTCLLLVLLLMWLTRPTVRALQKRLSYHSGENGVERKRSSYPALDRLTVSDCKVSSSNRNSDLEP